MNEVFVFFQNRKLNPMVQLVYSLLASIYILGPLTVEELNACLDSEYCSMIVLTNSVCFDEVME